MAYQDSGRLQEHELRQLLKQAEEKQRQAEEEKRHAEEEKRQTEKQMLPTSLSQFLDACHTYLSVGLSSRINHRTGTQGNPENVESKLRPDRIREWITFPKEQSQV